MHVISDATRKVTVQKLFGTTRSKRWNHVLTHVAHNAIDMTTYFAVISSSFSVMPRRGIDRENDRRSHKQLVNLSLSFVLFRNL